MADNWPDNWELFTSDPEMKRHIYGASLRTEGAEGYAEGSRYTSGTVSSAIGRPSPDPGNARASPGDEGASDCSEAPPSETAGTPEIRPRTAWEELRALRQARLDHAHEVVADARNHRNVAVLRRALRSKGHSSKQGA